MVGLGRCQQTWQTNRSTTSPPVAVPGKGDSGLCSWDNTWTILQFPEKRSRTRKEEKYSAWQIKTTAEKPGSSACLRSLLGGGVMYVQMGSKGCWNTMTPLNPIPFVPAGWWGLAETLRTLMTHEIHKLILDSYWSFNLHIFQALSLAVTAELLSLEISQMWILMYSLQIVLILQWKWLLSYIT